MIQIVISPSLVVFPIFNSVFEGQQHHIMEILQQDNAVSYLFLLFLVYHHLQRSVRLSAGRLDIYGPKLTSGLIESV